MHTDVGFPIPSSHPLDNNHLILHTANTTELRWWIFLTQWLDRAGEVEKVRRCVCVCVCVGGGGGGKAGRFADYPGSYTAFWYLFSLPWGSVLYSFVCFGPFCPEYWSVGRVSPWKFKKKKSFFLFFGLVLNASSSVQDTNGSQPRVSLNKAWKDLVICSKVESVFWKLHCRLYSLVRTFHGMPLRVVKILWSYFVHLCEHIR